VRLLDKRDCLVVCQISQLPPFSFQLWHSQTCRSSNFAPVNLSVRFLDEAAGVVMCTGQQRIGSQFATQYETAFVMKRSHHSNTNRIQVHLGWQSFFLFSNSQVQRLYFAASFHSTSEETTPSFAYSAVKLTGKFFSVLKDYGSKLATPQVVEGILDPECTDRPPRDVGLVTEFALDASLQESGRQRSRDSRSDSVPIIRLDPGEITELKIVSDDVDRRQSTASGRENYSRDCRLSTSPPHRKAEASDARGRDVIPSVYGEEIASSPEFGGDDIVFSSTTTKKKGKKLKKLDGEFSLMMLFHHFRLFSLLM
jgi:hypothetical protein